MKKHLFTLLLLSAVVILSAPANAQAVSPTPAQNQAVTPDPYRKPQPQLSENDQKFIIEAALEAKSRQKTPEGFSPGLGAIVPKEVSGTAFQPEVSAKLPILKEYQYAYLDREIILINALEKKVVAIVPLPSQLVSTTVQGGATNPSPADPEKVKAYTSPQSTK